MLQDDFFTERPSAWGPERTFDGHLAQAVKKGPLPGESESDVASTLALVVWKSLEAFGTGRAPDVSDDKIATALAALVAISKRLGLSFDPPFRDYSDFEFHWKRQGCYGDYQCRRELLRDLFDPLLSQLEAGDGDAGGLVSQASSHPGTGWPQVDAEIDDLRKVFARAETAAECAAVGLVSVRVLEALSATVYDHQRHAADPESAEPPVSNTKQRLERVIEVELSGKGSAELRKLARASIEAAQALKHRSTPTRRDVGLGADAVILLASLVRRILT